jgi:hypothetical protein
MAQSIWRRKSFPQIGGDVFAGAGPGRKGRDLSIQVDVIQVAQNFRRDTIQLA